MATTVNLYEDKDKLSELVDAAADGEDVIIARDGIPVARLTTLTQQKLPLRLGLMEGQIWIADDFDAPLPDDILAAFEGR